MTTEGQGDRSQGSTGGVSHEKSAQLARGRGWRVLCDPGQVSLPLWAVLLPFQ